MLTRRWTLVVLVLAMGVGCGGPGEGGEGGEGSEGASTGGSTGGGTGGSTGGSTGGEELEPRLAECLRVAACEADGGTPAGVQVCLGHALDLPWLWASVGVQRAAVEAMACKLAATDCAGVRACTPAKEAFAAECAARPGQGFCAGDVWVLCDDLGAPASAFACSAAGMKCGEDVWAGCGVLPCEFGVTEASCDLDAPDVLVECGPAGFLSRVDCRTSYNYVIVGGKGGDEVYSIAGETCGYDPMRGANGCVGTGAVCDFFSQTCDGAVLETCAGGKLARRECAAVEPAGQGCGYFQGGPFAGAASCGLVGTACDLADDEACDGDVLRYCDLGVKAAVDCRKAGYSGCASESREGRTIAFCTP